MQAEPTGDAFRLVASVAGFAASSIVTYCTYLFARLKTDHQFRIQKSEQIRSVGSTYSSRLAKLLNGMQSFWGYPFSAHALGICIVFQLLFSSFFFLVFWALGGSGKIGHTSLLPNWGEYSYRWLFFFGFCLYSLLIAITIRFCGDIDVSLRKMFARATITFKRAFGSNDMSTHERAGRRRRLVQKISTAEAKQGTTLLVLCSWLAVFISLVPIIYVLGGVQGFATIQLLVISLAFMAAIAAGVSLPGFAPFMVALSWVSIAVIISPILFEGTASSLVALASIIGFVSSFWLATRGKAEYYSFGAGVGIAGSLCSFFVGYLVASGVNSGTTFANSAVVAIILFLILFPAINGLSDWLSLAVSRKVGGRLLEHISGGRLRKPLNVVFLFGYVLGGFAWGMACMFLLVGGLTASVNEFNMAARAEGFLAPLPLDRFITAIEDNSTGPEALWVLMMLITTFLPVCAYLISVIFFPFSKFLFSPETREVLAQELSQVDPKHDLGPCYRATIHLFIRISIGVLVLTILVIAAYFIFSGAFKLVGSTLLGYSKYIISLTEGNILY